jgi:hypothetical protein
MNHGQPGRSDPFSIPRRFPPLQSDVRRPELGVFERLHRSPAGAETVARELSLQADATERLLDTCVGLDLLAKKDGVYSNLPAATTYPSGPAPRRSSVHRLPNRVGYKGT